jgi:hypothetical protein
LFYTSVGFAGMFVIGIVLLITGAVAPAKCELDYKVDKIVSEDYATKQKAACLAKGELETKIGIAFTVIGVVMAVIMFAIYGMVRAGSSIDFKKVSQSLKDSTANIRHSSSEFGRNAYGRVSELLRRK